MRGLVPTDKVARAANGTVVGYTEKNFSLIGKIGATV
jgi:hypothetical protein